MDEITIEVENYIAKSNILSKLLSKRDKEKISTEISDLIKSLSPKIIKAYETECYIEDIGIYCKEHKVRLTNEEFDTVLSRLSRKFDNSYSYWENIEMQIDFVKGLYLKGEEENG